MSSETHQYFLVVAFSFSFLFSRKSSSSSSSSPVGNVYQNNTRNVSSSLWSRSNKADSSEGIIFQIEDSMMQFGDRLDSDVCICIFKYKLRG